MGSDIRSSIKMDFFLIQRLFIFFILTLLAATEANGQVADTVDAAVTITPQAKSRLPAGHSPKGALRRAMMVPGWGQAYNRQYWKIPIVYAGIGGVAALAVGFGKKHQLYTRAFQYKAWQEQVDAGQEESNPFPQYQDEYLEVIAERGSTGADVHSSSIKPFRDNFRRNRDLSLFGIGLVYGLSVLDAFVNAHLLDFDVDEDLTVQLYPHPHGVTASVRIGL